ncbi:MAG: hypothetical protein FWB95_06470 [Treponema sp.]|nr:hypothetical protein [Treponema sp.]
MKRFLTILCLTLFVTGFAAAQVRVGGTLYVSVKTISLKAGTGFFSGTKGTLNLGDQVTVIQISGKNVEVRSVRNTSLTGWTSSGNFTTKQIVTGTSSTATAKEVALAGKGFNQDVEQSYRNQQRNLNYADVDRVETITVSETDLKRFLDEGRLKTGE